MSPMPASYEQFAQLLSQRTGLSIQTTRAWTLSEYDPHLTNVDNPLNIMCDARAGRICHYGSMPAAVDATVRLLNSYAGYKPILATAASPKATVRDELTAIIRSPWEETGYSRGHATRDGWRLFGAFARLYPAAAASTSAGSSSVPKSGGSPFNYNPLTGFGIPDAVSGAAVQAKDAATSSLTGWVGDLTGWLEPRVVLMFLYLALTGLALVLLVQGLTRSVGSSPSRVVGGVLSGRAARAAQAAEIPF